MGLSHIRHKAKITQDELSKKSGVSRVTIARIGSGNQNNKLNTLLKLADALDTPVGDLIKPDTTDSA